MLPFGIPPLLSLLESCKSVKQAFQVYAQIILNGFQHHVFPISRLISFFAFLGSEDGTKLGALSLGERLRSSIPKGLKTVSLFNLMISGLAQHGLGESALPVFGEMESIRLKPDSVTFVAVLSACSHSGLIKVGKELFRSMSYVYGIKPHKEHYGCKVDLLGRDGCLDEAYDLIQKPDHGAHYILLSNMLANTNKWERAKGVRKVMEDRGIQKPPGWSYIEFRGTTCRFLASDKSHLQDKGVESMLQDMAIRLKSAGYVPNTAQVVFDIDEEEKETVVSYHSEKLPLAFGLVNSGTGETTRIMKNL
ncbi:putative pectate lyase 12-like [Hibiscus syriacus]|uniref:Putative pectate lyase 12-like n=1 Tax=Hibiscus syriacus TaxID=106335 RepID=A0A6A3BUC3_HIBSY|nr:putative pectate lyase 12-like [Hibiscus syriacus]